MGLSRIDLCTAVEQPRREKKIAAGVASAPPECAPYFSPIKAGRFWACLRWLATTVMTGTMAPSNDLFKFALPESKVKMNPANPIGRSARCAIRGPVCD